jgi:hypothetical protein
MKEFGLRIKIKVWENIIEENARRYAGRRM